MARSKPRAKVRGSVSPSRQLKQQQGFSLPLIIVTALILIFGTAALASRSTMGLLGSVFQNQSWEAREAAEIGMNRIISELNKERNRWLMVQRTGDPDSGIWQNRQDSQRVVEWRTNPCRPTGSNSRPDYTKLDPNGAASTSYGTWYVDANGTVSSSSSGAVRAYKLVAVTRQPFETTYNGATIQALNINRDRTATPSGVGSITLVVQGQAIRNGRTVATVSLEKQLELAPKCCKVSFGGQHGGLNYGMDSSTNTSLCVQNDQLGLGLIGGAGDNNTGSITLRGRATDIVSSTGADIDPIYCLASTTSGCATNISGSTINVALIDMDIPKAKEYPGTMPSTLTDLNLDTTGSGRITATTTTDFIYTKSLSTTPRRDIIVINAGATTNIPSYCTTAISNELHCALNSISYKNSDVYILTGSKKLRLYFPTGGATVIDNAGNGALYHCSDTAVSSSGTCTRASGAKVTDLSLFGCNISASCTTSNPQVIELKGNADSLGLFSYFPSGSVSLVGDTNFEGINWSNSISSSGNPTWTVPGSGVGSVYDLMGMIPSSSSSGTATAPLIAYDFIARATNRYRWK